MAFYKAAIIGRARGQLRGITYRTGEAGTTIMSKTTPIAAGPEKAWSQLRYKLRAVVSTCILGPWWFIGFWLVIRNSGRSDKPNIGIESMRAWMIAIFWWVYKEPFYNYYRPNYIYTKKAFEYEKSQLPVNSFQLDPIAELWGSRSFKISHAWRYPVWSPSGTPVNKIVWIGLTRFVIGIRQRYFLTIPDVVLNTIPELFTPAGADGNNYYNIMVMTWAPWLKYVKSNTDGLIAIRNELPRIVYRRNGWLFIDVTNLIPQEFEGDMEVQERWYDADALEYKRVINPNMVLQSFGVCLEPTRLMKWKGQSDYQKPGEAWGGAPAVGLKKYIDAEFLKPFSESERKRLFGGLVLTIENYPYVDVWGGYGSTFQRYKGPGAYYDWTYNPVAGDGYLMVPPSQP